MCRARGAGTRTGQCARVPRGRRTPHRARFPPRPRQPASLFLDELTSALIKRAERLIGGNSRADLVVIPRVLRLRRLLDLDEVRGMNLAPVDANRPLATEWIVGRHLLHLGDDLGAAVALEIGRASCR